MLIVLKCLVLSFLKSFTRFNLQTLKAHSVKPTFIKHEIFYFMLNAIRLYFTYALLSTLFDSVNISTLLTDKSCLITTHCVLFHVYDKFEMLQAG